MNTLIETHLIKFNLEHVIAVTRALPWWCRLLQTRRYVGALLSLQASVRFAARWQKVKAVPGYKEFSELAEIITMANTLLPVSMQIQVEPSQPLTIYQAAEFALSSPLHGS